MLLMIAKYYTYGKKKDTNVFSCRHLFHPLKIDVSKAFNLEISVFYFLFYISLIWLFLFIFLLFVSKLFHIYIYITLNYIIKEIPFIDVLVKNQNGKIETDIFYKETDSRQYLLFYSCHPRHTKVNIPYNLARRIRTIDDTTLNNRMEELKCFLNKQKCPEQVIDYGVKRAMALDKNDLRKIKPKTTQNIIHFVSTHNPKDPQMFNVIRENLPILEEDDIMRRLLSNYKLIKSKRQPYNLKRLLTKAKFQSNGSLEVRRCNKPTCGLCIHLLEGSTIQFNCGINFKVHENMSCNVSNVIYAMKCRGCGEEYIRETGGLLRRRVTVHNQQIRDPRTRTLKVSEQIDICANTLTPKYQIFPFYKMYSESISLRRAKERYFIDTLKPKLNRAA